MDDGLSYARSLGFAGSAMLALSLLPRAGILLGLSGFLLLSAALRYASGALGERAIFSNAAAASAIGAVGLAVSELTFLGAFVAGGPVTLLGAAARAFNYLAAAWLAAVASSILLRRSYRPLARASGDRLFELTSALYLVGAALSLILIGYILIFSAFIVQAAAFLSLRGAGQQRDVVAQIPSSTAALSLIIKYSIRPETML